jgi:YVTN family beta-propeller protein
MSPTQPLLYATIPSPCCQPSFQNSIAIINTNTLAVETVTLDYGPTKLTFSPDGSKAYMVAYPTPFLLVFDTQTRTIIQSFLMPDQLLDVVFANQNRLFVLGRHHIFQVDATTGASSGPSIGDDDVEVYDGFVEISADRNTLYYGDSGRSSSTMYKFNVSGGTPILLLQTSGNTGGAGENLMLSHNNRFICYPAEGYRVAKFRTSDFATLGSFNTGSSPVAVAFSPDDMAVYLSVHYASGMKVFDTNTFLPVGTIPGPEVASKLAIDPTGRYLFAAYTASNSSFIGIRVYDTGRVTTVVSAPTANAPTNVVTSGFTASWSPVAVATGYRLDISLSNTFNSYLTGYQDLDVGNVTSFSVSGLNSETTYYYRVRAYGPPGTSVNSNIVGVLTALVVPPAFGHLTAQYSFRSNALVMNPTQPYMYAAVPSHNSVAIINTNTLAVESIPLVGSGPTNLGFSPDGSKAYITNGTSNFVAVFDTQTRTVINSFLIPEYPQDVVLGTQNRLFVLGTNNIFQIDATTGASTGPNIEPTYVFSGALEISPDGNSLYYCDYGLTPARMYKFDVSTPNPVLVWQTPFATVGSNGEDLSLSHDGTFISYATGSGQNNYKIAKFRTSDQATLGLFDTGPYPTAIAFSPDDLVAYASVDTAHGTKIFDTNTFVSAGTISDPEVAVRLAVDSTGRYLFAGYGGYYSSFSGTRVFDTGRAIALSAVSRKNHGAAGTFDIPLPLTGTTGVECRLGGGTTNDYTIVVTFAGNISVTGNPQAQVTAGSATIGSGGASNGGAVSVDGSIVTIPLTNVTNEQTIIVRLNGLPVGATSTGAMTIPIGILIGDTTGNFAVNGSDVACTKSQVGQAITASNFRNDLTANGVINASDISLVKSHSSTALRRNE